LPLDIHHGNLVSQSLVSSDLLILSPLQFLCNYRRIRTHLARTRPLAIEGALLAAVNTPDNRLLSSLRQHNPNGRSALACDDIPGAEREDPSSAQLSQVSSR
jgi:hypothetical protein